MTEKKLSILSKTIFSVAALGLFLFITYKNFEPFGIKLHFTKSDKKPKISVFSPLDRTIKINENGREITKQISDIIYFTTVFPSRIESGKVSLRIKNPNPDLDVYLGYQDKDEWHFDKKLIDSPLLNNISWPRTGNDPLLFQKIKKYRNFEDFIKNPPQSSVIGFYKYDKELLLKDSKIEGYQPSKDSTIFSVPLIGKHTFYVYDENEIFKMNIFLQDLNKEEGPDVTTIRIYKENTMVFEQIIDDDGIESANGKVLPDREAEIQNPGPELPEPGVYKVVIDAPDDTVIKKISTNLHKLVLESPIHLAEKSEPTTLISTAKTIALNSPSNKGLQIIKAGNEELKIEKIKTDYIYKSQIPRYEIVIPKNNLIIKGQLGYFSTNESNFFEPSFYSLMPINDISDIEIADYIITAYNPPKSEGEWHNVVVSFDLKNARPNKGNLSWIIQVPKLKENGKSIAIDLISVDFNKNPIIKWN